MTTDTTPPTFADRPGGALVTGGSGAIGAAVCTALAAAGCDIAFAYGRNTDAAERTRKAIEGLGRRTHVGSVHIGDADEVADFVGAAAGALGGIHTVVTAAAPVASQQWVSRITPDHFRDQLLNDVAAFHHVVRATVPLLRESGGSIVAVTTVANRRYVLRDVLSTAPKAAVEAVVQAVAAEEGRYGIRANAVGVGILGEGMSETLMERGEVRQQDMDHALARIPLGRLGHARDIAEAVVFLASDRASYITGQWLDVDGGYAV